MREYIRLIKSQGEQVCKDQMDLTTILKRVEDFTFGFIHISTKANVGRRRLSFTDKQSVNGFIFCRYMEEEREIIIDIVCSRRHMKLGRRLMNEVEKMARRLDVYKLSLCALAEESLKNWYVSLGFKVMDTIPLPYDRNGIKSYYMVKMVR